MDPMGLGVLSFTFFCMCFVVRRGDVFVKAKPTTKCSSFFRGDVTSLREIEGG